MLKHYSRMNHFAAVANETVQSLDCMVAKGLLLTLVEVPPGQDVTVEKLARTHKQGVKSLEAAMRLLVQRGLVVKLKIQSVHGNRWRTEFTVNNGGAPVTREFVKQWIEGIPDIRAIRVEPAYLDPATPDSPTGGNAPVGESAGTNLPHSVRNDPDPRPAESDLSGPTWENVTSSQVAPTGAFPTVGGAGIAEAPTKKKTHPEGVPFPCGDDPRNPLSQAAASRPLAGGVPADAGRGGGEERDHGGVEDPGVPDGGGPVGDAPSNPGGWPPVADAGSGGGRSSRSNGSGGGAPSFADGFVSVLYDELPGGLRLRLVRQVAKLERGGWAPWQVLALLADDGALVREREPGRLVLSVLRDSEGLRPPSEAVADRLWPDGWRQEPLQVLLEDVWDAFRASGASAPLAGAQGAVCGFPDCDVRLLPGDPPGGECASCAAMRQLGVTEMGELYARWLCSDRMAWAQKRLAGEPVFAPDGS